MDGCATETAELFRRFVCHAAVERKITLDELWRRAGVSHECCRRGNTPKLLTMAYILQALREESPLSPLEERRLLSILGAIDEIDIPAVNMAEHGQRIVRERKLAAG